MSDFKPKIGIASMVTMHLSLSMKDGTVTESTFDDDPLEFTMGDGTLIHGLELALYGLRAGDKQRLELEPEQAFGLHDPKKIHPMPLEAFPPELELSEGALVSFTDDKGEEILGLVNAMGDEAIQVDFNHPLAGHVIIFDVEILDVITTNNA